MILGPWVPAGERGWARTGDQSVELRPNGVGRLRLHIGGEPVADTALHRLPRSTARAQADDWLRERGYRLPRGERRGAMARVPAAVVDTLAELYPGRTLREALLLAADELRLSRCVTAQK